ncbi:MAG: protein-glutamate O-methyltransferase CheR [Candidatus Melainabacteria bacterium]|nr:protein-glutamate O-methyltransferase CheR [Candidatus Melainabacteria bacterium]
MTITLTTDEFHMLSSLIQNECGITLQEDKKYLIESRLGSLLIETGCSTFSEFYLKAKTNSDTELKDKIVDAITTNETLWFRDETPFIVLKEKLFPEFYSQNTSCRIWSAACSTGQEPYSIVMAAHEGCGQHFHQPLESQLSVFATDISLSALMQAKNARYNTVAMSRGLSDELKKKYFEEEEQGKTYRLKENITRFVTFQKFNLQMPFDSLGEFNIIFLRNAAIYFSKEFKIELFKKISKSLKPGGYLFIGASESLIGYSDDFKMLEYNKCRYYQLKD